MKTLHFTLYLYILGSDAISARRLLIIYLSRSTTHSGGLCCRSMFVLPQSQTRASSYIYDTGNLIKRHEYDEDANAAVISLYLDVLLASSCQFSQVSCLHALAFVLPGTLKVGTSNFVRSWL